MTEQDKLGILPSPTTTYAPPSLAQQLLPLLGATLAFLGREFAPRLLRRATDWVQVQISCPPKLSSGGTYHQGGRGRGGRRCRRQRRRRR